MSWWQRSDRFDPRAVAIADRHYNRQSPGTNQFVPPGRCLVLRHGDDAVWVTSWQYPEHVDHAWPGAWNNCLFRNESERLSSELILEAVAHTRSRWETPAEGMITFIDPTKIRRKRDPGRCYRRAGFVEVGTSRSGMICLWLDPARMPAASGYDGEQLRLFG